MDFRFTPEQEAFRQELRQFLKRELPADWHGVSHDAAWTDEGFRWGKHFARRLGERGWLTVSWPKEYGGLGLSVIHYLIFREEMAYHEIPGVTVGVGGTDWAGPTLLKVGTEAQKKRYLTKISRGEEWWCTGYSEPGAGSDLASLKTRAVRGGDEYVVNGQKIWTSGGHRADMCWLAARTDQDAPKHKGISVFIVDMKSPGVTVRPIITLAGFHYFNEIFFDNVRVPAANLVGQENGGWYILAMALDFERSGIRYAATTRRHLEEAVAYCRQTKQNSRCLYDDPLVRHKLADLAVDIEVQRLFAYRVAWMQERGIVPNKEASICKVFGTELIQKVERTILQVVGTAGQLKPGSRHAPLGGRPAMSWLSSTFETIAAGTSEVQRNIIAQRGLGLPR